MPNANLDYARARRAFLRSSIATAVATVATGVAAGPALAAPDMPGPDMAAAVTAYEKAEAALRIADSTGTEADMDAASAAWSDAILDVAEQLPLSAADLRAAARVLVSVRAREPRDYPSAEQHALTDELLADICAGRLV